MSDRRLHSRDPAIANRGSLGWPSAIIPCRIVDISRGGAKIQIEAAAQPPERLRIRLESPASTDWTSARVVRREGADRVAVAFEGSCPVDLYVGARLGISLRPLVRRDGRPEPSTSA